MIAMIRSIFAIALVSSIITPLVAQQEELAARPFAETSDRDPGASHSLIPYRRVFVPTEALQKAIGRRDYTPSDQAQSAMMLKSFETDSATAAVYQSPPELESSFYTARLVGTNLVSELSRIQINRGSFIGERLTLAPWSLHLQPAGEKNSISQDGSLSLGRFAFDRQGVPSIGLHLTDPKLANEKLEVTFGWTLSSEAISPGKQSFRAAIPACSNSLLIVALPPNSRVEEANVPVVKLSSWSELDLRLSEWKDKAEQATKQVSSNTSDSFWLLELGGIRNLNFIVSTRTDVTSSELDKTNPFDDLILNQKIDHQISLNRIVSKCSLDIPLDTQRSTDSEIRIKIDSASRLLRVKSQNRDLDWRLEGGFLVLRKSSIFLSATPRELNATLEIETISEFSDSALESDIALPNFAVDRSYVLKGVTHLECTKDVQLSRIHVANGRLLEATSQKGMSYEWWLKPTDIVVQGKKSDSGPQSKILYRVLGQDEVLTFRARVILAGPPESDLCLDLEPGWTILDVLVPSTKKTVPWEVFWSSKSQTEKIVVRKEDVQTIGTEIDFHLSPSDVLAKNFIFPSEGWIRFNDKSSKKILIVENLVDGWQLPSIDTEAMIATDSLDANERSFVDTLDDCVVWTTKNKRFVFTKLESANLRTVEVTTSISRTAESSIKIEHMFRENSPVASQRPKFQLPWMGWRSEPSTMVPEFGATPLEASPDGPTPVLRLELPFVETSETSVVSVQCEMQCGREGVLIPTPAFSSNIKLSHRLRVDSSIDVQSSASHGRWVCDKYGEIVLELTEGSPAPLVKIHEASDSQLPGKGSSATVNVFVDGHGKSTCKWSIQLPYSSAGSNAIRLRDGWYVDNRTLKVAFGEGHAWIEPGKDGKEFLLHFLNTKNSTTEEKTIGVSFDANHDELLWTSESLVPEFVTPFRLPCIELDDECLNSSGRLWVPSDQPWLVNSNTKQNYGDGWGMTNHWDATTGAPWWTHVSRLFLAESLGTSNSIKSNKAEKWNPIGYWKKIAEWKESKNETIKHVAHGARFQVLGGLLFCIVFFGTTCGLYKYKWIVAMVAFLLTAAYLLIPFHDPIFRLPLSMSLAGCAFGLLISSVARVVPIQRMNKSSSGREDSAVGWDAPRSIASKELLPPIGGAVLPFLGLSIVVLGNSLGLAQVNPSPSDQARFSQSPFESTDQGRQQFDLIFPLEESNDSTPSTVYVPDSLFASIKGNPSSSLLLYSSKHQWKIASRTRTLAGPDQFSSLYELWVGTEGTPVEFPIRSSLSRFVVNDLEIAYGARLQRNLSNNTIVWTPEKPGRYRVQLVFTPQYSSEENDTSSAESAFQSQLFDFGIMPSANATLDIDASDPLLQLELESLGGITTPTAGKFTASLGNTPRIKGRLKFPSNGFAGLPRPTVVTEIPTLCTEFLLSETVQARTVIQIPAGASLGEEFEMEVDGAWQPIGRAWGNVQLVETRDSNFYFRRRYVFSNSAGVSKETDNKASQISILWGVRDASTNSLNAIFAECTDRRIRSSILRFARTSEAAWNIDEVNTWQTLIGERERLDWPELITTSLNPRATSLRIPPNGGFGILRRSQKQGTVQARIATRWTLNSDSESIFSRIEVIGPWNNDYLELDIPEGFVVTEARRRQGSIVLLQSERGNNNANLHRVQLLMDRLQTDRLPLRDFDLSIRAERSRVGQWTSASPPTISLSGIRSLEQSIELAAIDQWKIQVETPNEPSRPLFGRGVNSVLTTIAPEQRVAMERRLFPSVSKLQHKFEAQPGSDKVQLTIRGGFELSNNSSSKFIVEIPDWLEEYWNCDRSASMVPCPIENKAWLQLDLGPPSDENEDRDWMIQFSLVRDELLFFRSNPTLIRILNSQLQPIPFSIDLEESKLLVDSDPSNSQLTTRSYVWRDKEAANEKQQNVVRYWIDRASPSLDWKIASKEQIVAVYIQGEEKRWTWNDGLLSVEMPRQAGGWMVEATLVLFDNDGTFTVPELRSETATVNQLSSVRLIEDEDQAVDVVLEILGDKLDSVSEELRTGSYGERWFSFWGSMLQELRQNLSLEAQMDGKGELIVQRVLKLCPRLATPDGAMNPVRLRLYPSHSSKNVPSSASSDELPSKRMGWLVGLQTIVFFVVAFTNYGRWKNRPWWALISAAILFWLMTGWMIIPSLIVLSAVISAADTYWLRRSSNAIQRSQQARMLKV